MQNKSSIAGILAIIGGAFGILWLGGSWLSIYMVKYMFSSPLYGSFPSEFYTLMTAMYLSYGVVGAILGILGIIGGIFALKKRHWGWALTGTIAGIITFFPTGIAAIVLLSMGREEFLPSKAVITQE
jgi:hypothetical protein